MPLLTISYSANLTFQPRALMHALHHAILATGAVNLKGLRSRALKVDDFFIGGGDESYMFVHVDIQIREGRPIEAQQAIAEATMATLQQFFGHLYEIGHIALSNDIKELKFGTAITKHNIPAGTTLEPLP